ncbi:Leucine-rich repeat domain superfamily [Sesbania bispinosa]|nr:Leucine-rich repeat domain superfamily [Sesbania bispinosa]
MLENLGPSEQQTQRSLTIFQWLIEVKVRVLNYNEFESIPEDFFDGLESLEVLALDYNSNLNATTGGWQFPSSLQGSAQLTNLSCMSCNLVGPIPDFLGKMVVFVGVATFRQQLNRLGGNNLSGEIPSNWTSLRSLTLLDLSGNNISPPLPNFSKSLKLVIDGNPQLVDGGPEGPSSGTGSSSRKPEPSHLINPSADSNSHHRRERVPPMVKVHW